MLKEYRLVDEAMIRVRVRRGAGLMVVMVRVRCGAGLMVVMVRVRGGAG